MVSFRVGCLITSPLWVSTCRADSMQVFLLARSFCKPWFAPWLVWLPEPDAEAVVADEDIDIKIEDGMADDDGEPVDGDDAFDLSRVRSESNCSRHFGLTFSIKIKSSSGCFDDRCRLRPPLLRSYSFWHIVAH